MRESPYWVGWAAGSWSISWGYDATGRPIEVDDRLHQGGPDGRGRSARGRSRYAEAVQIDRAGGKHAVRPANWKAPWQRDDPDPDPVTDARIEPPAPDVKSLTLAPATTPTPPTPPTPLPVTQAEMVAARQAVDKVVTQATQAVDALQSSQADALALATALLLLLDDEDY